MSTLFEFFVLMNYFFILFFILSASISNACFLNNEQYEKVSFFENCLPILSFFSKKKDVVEQPRSHIQSKSNSFLEKGNNLFVDSNIRSFSLNDSNYQKDLIRSFSLVDRNSERSSIGTLYSNSVLKNFLKLLGPFDVVRFLQTNKSSNKALEKLINFFSDQLLSFSNKDISRNVFSSIKNRCYSEIKKLSLIRSNFSLEDLREIPETLVELSIQDFKPGKVPQSNFSERLINIITQKFKNLEKLDLSDISLNDEDIKKIASMSKLKELRLNNCFLHSEHIEALSQMKSLAKLKLPNNLIGNKGAEKLSQMRNIIELNLSNNGISNKGARVLFENTYLTGLNLSKNNIGNGSLLDIFEMSKSLKDLDLSNNKIGDSVACALLKHSFNRLDLSFNLINFSKNNNSKESKIVDINYLNFSGNDIDDDGASNLFKMGVSIVDLNVSANKIGPSGKTELLKIKDLKKIDLSENPVSKNKKLVLARKNETR